MSTTAIIQARMSSTRFPGKVLHSLNGKNSIQHIVDRLKRSVNIDNIIVATTTNPADEAIVAYCAYNNISFFCGSENDVLDRVYQCALANEVDVVVDLTADCPFIDIDMVDEMITLLNVYGYDYYSNVVERTWPDGFDIQVYTFKTLEYIWQNVEQGPHRCHTGWNVLKYDKMFRIGNLDAPKGYRLPEMGLTLDTVEDAEVISEIFKKFDNKYFSVFECIDFVLEHPELMAINSNVERKIPGMG